MDGKNHLIVGLISSGAALLATQAPFHQMIVPLIVGGVSSLAPDLDHQNSLLVKRVSQTTKKGFFIGLVLGLIYLLVHLYKNDTEMGILLISAIIGVFGVTIAVLKFSKSKTKQLILVAGGTILAFGLVYQLISLILLGVFVAIASRLSHRGLTHSLYFLIFWYLICFFIQKDTGFPYIVLTGTIGYLSHLLADDWFTKTKIKWLRPTEPKKAKKKIKKLKNKYFH